MQAIFYRKKPLEFSFIFGCTKSQYRLSSHLEETPRLFSLFQTATLTRALKFDFDGFQTNEIARTYVTMFSVIINAF